MVRILHFSDAHINIANYGRRDPDTGLPLRIMDFLKSLDTIVDTAINEKVDLVLFAGDAFNDRTPAPTFQREWGQRMMKLSKAGIPTLVLVGNHDLSPSITRAHSLEAINTYEVPYLRVLDKPQLLTPEMLHGVPIQIIAFPWMSKSGITAYLDLRAEKITNINRELEKRILGVVDDFLQKTDRGLPVVFTSHASVEGSVYGGERSVMLGNDMVLSKSMFLNRGFDYIALGHIHKAQDLNKDGQPHIVYPGSIERVDFGEAKEKKYFVIADVEKENTKVNWRELKDIRPYIDVHVEITEQTDIMKQILSAFPPEEKIRNSVIRLVLAYPRDWSESIDEREIRLACSSALEFKLVRHPKTEARIRLPEEMALEATPAVDLVDFYLKSIHTDPSESEELKKMAEEIISESESSVLMQRRTSGN